MSESINFSAFLNGADFIHLLPVIVLSGWACVVMFAASFGRQNRESLGALSIIGLLLTLGSIVYSWSGTVETTYLFSDMMMTNRFTLFVDFALVFSTILTLLIASPYLKEHQFDNGEFYGVLMLSLAGMAVMVHSADFLTLVIGLETMSLGVYALVAGWPGKARSAEGGLKYFIMGAVASAFLFYGIALIYGSTGLTNIAAISKLPAEARADGLFLIGMLMILSAFAFKVALVPFHMWTPDAYEGAPSPVTGFMAAAVKTAGFAIFIRVLAEVFFTVPLAFSATGWLKAFMVLSVITMTVGNLLALRQHNIKRMLAYSSIAHAGFILLGVVAVFAGSKDTMSSVLFYLVVYGVTTIGCFGIVSWIGNRNKECVGMDDWSGLATKHPVAAALMTFFLLSLAGIPPTGGFIAKLNIIRDTFDYPVLFEPMIIAIVNSMFAVFYYLRPIVAMYFKPIPRNGEFKPLQSSSVYLSLAICAVVVLYLGIDPHLLMDLIPLR